jgi:hypothetical protein
MTVGYSGTALAKKLGFRGPVFGLNVPESVKRDIEATAPVSWLVDMSKAQDAFLFVTLRAELEALLAEARRTLPDTVTVWISWPKKASKVATDITEDVIRDICLPIGWVDVKVCAVDQVWSGLKLVVRKELRNISKAEAA